MTAPADAPLPDLPARFALRGLLGRGGMGAVHAVHDTETGRDLALKTLAPQAGVDMAEARFLFKQEFWAMHTLRHPHLVAAHDYGESPDGTAWITMDLVPGHDVGQDLPASEAAVRGWLPGVLAALGFLHGRGWRHGDLKPENLRVGDDGQARLMDLGLIERIGRPGGPIRGTLAYLAPEAVRQGALDGRADLYALGAVLFHVLTGQPPFTQADTLGLLRAHLDQRPPAPRERVPALTAELDAVVRKLLAKDPADRYASAADVAAALGLDVSDDAAPGLLAAPLVGRDELLAELEAGFAAPVAGGVYLAGEPGSGRTRLLDALRAAAQLAGLPTPTARGEAADAAPYAALAPWLRALGQVRGPEAERLGPLVARLVPGTGAEPAPPLEGAQERLRAHDSVAELATLAFPAASIWLLDDADRLDPASRELLGALRRAGGDRGWIWLLAGAAGEPPLADLPTRPLPALSDAEVLALAGHLLGQADLPAEVADPLPTLAAGRPAAVEAALAHWLRSGALVRTGGRWQAAPGVAFDAPSDLAEALATRLSELGPDAVAIATAAARLGPPADPAWLADVVDLDQAAFFAGLGQLREAGVLAVTGDRFRFERPALAEALATGPDPAFHGRAFRALSARAGESPDLERLLALARHGLASADPAVGVPAALAAARAAAAIHAVTAAAGPLALALAVSGLDPATRAALLAAQGYGLRFQGEIDQALALYDQELLPLLRETPGPDLVEHLVTRGVLVQLKGRYDDALASHAEAIELADPLGCTLQAVRARLFAGRVAFFAGKPGLARTLLGAAVRRARALVAGGEPAALPLLGRALGFFGYVTATASAAATGEGLALLDEAIALNRELGDLRETHEALNNQGNVLMAVGRYPEARAVFEACLALCGRMGSANEAVIAELNLGSALGELGRPAEAEAMFRRSVAGARAQGRKFPEGYAIAGQGLATIRLGDPGLGLARVAEGLAIAQALQNKYLELSVLAYQVQAQLEAGAWEAAGTTLAAARALAAETSNAEFDPKLQRAELALAVAAGAPDAPGRLAVAIGEARAAHATAQLAHLLRQLAAWQARQGAWREAERPATEALDLAQALGLRRVEAEAHALLARAAEALGEPGRASDHLQAAVGVAEEAGDTLGLTLARAALARARRDARARREAAARLEAMTEGLAPAARQDFLRDDERRAAMAILADDAGLDPARVGHLTALVASLAEAEDLPAVMDQALAALIELAEADRGFLVLYDGFEERERLFLTAPSRYVGGGGEASGARSPDGDEAFSTGVAQHVLWTGEPLFVEDAATHGELSQQASIQRLNLRAVLGLPLKVAGQTIGVMIADSRRIARGFGEAELELALALAQAVALAIGHARRHAEQETRLRTLEAVQALALATAGMADPAARAQAALAQACAETGADRGFVLLGDELTVLAARGPAGPLNVACDAPDVSRSVCAWVREHREAMHMVDVQSDDAFAGARSVMALGLRTVWAVPLGDHGLMYLDSQRLREDAGLSLGALSAIAGLLQAGMRPADAGASGV